MSFQIFFGPHKTTSTDKGREIQENAKELHVREVA